MDIKKILLILLSIVLWGCSNNSSNYNPDEDPKLVESSFGSASLNNNTRIISEESANSISIISQDGTSITFENPDLSISSLESGDIIIIGISARTPNGFLRRVSSKQVSGNRVVLETEQATLEDAFNELELSYNESLASNSIQKIEYIVPEMGIHEVLPPSRYKQINGFFRIEFDQVVYDSDKDTLTKGDQIKLKGEIKMSPEIDFRIKIQRAQLNWLRFALSNDIENTIEIIAGFSEDFKKKTSKIILKKWLQPIPIGPIVITPVFEIVVGVKGEANIGIKSQVRANVYSKGGIEYRNGQWAPIVNFDSNFEADPPNFEANASLKGYLGPHFNLFIYGITGPYFAAEGYGEVSVDLFREPKLQIYGGIESSAGVKFKLFKFLKAEYKIPNLYNRKWLLYEAGYTGSPELSTLEVTNIGPDSAVTGGSILYGGSSEIIEQGICWGVERYPNLLDSCITGDRSDQFSSIINGLTGSTDYYVRAYAKNNSGVAYGNEQSFQTLPPTIPVIKTAQVKDITTNSAIISGKIISTGGADVETTDLGRSYLKNPFLKGYGACLYIWTEDDPLGCHYSSSLNEDKFEVKIGYLIEGSSYYVRSFLRTKEGIGWGDFLFFTTLKGNTKPVVSTNTIQSITATTAISGGSITSTGGGSITSKGICWSTNTSPDLNDNCESGGSGSGSFTETMTGLNPNTTYYVRAYARNSAGTGYGNQRSFTTPDADERVLDLNVCEEWSVSQSGGYGVTVDNWNIDEIPSGAVFDIRFDAISIPDKFVVEYPNGNSRFDSGWRGDSEYDGDSNYPGGVTSPGNDEEFGIFTKSSNNQFRVIVTGVDNDTQWNYSVRCRY